MTRHIPEGDDGARSREIRGHLGEDERDQVQKICVLI
jgi:hypothetical protein